MPEPVKARLKQEASFVEAFLAGCLDAADMPPGLREARYYSLLAGGKRLRPVLCLNCGGLFGLEKEKMLPFAAAIECIHSYSLIHDDLPAMDNDDLRRGKPTSHKRFGEASAILAGDALLTDAFAFMASCGLNNSVRPELALKALALIASAAGSGGMVGGQFLDMQYTGRGSISLEELRRMHALKTGALLRAACLSGALLAGAAKADLERVEAYGTALGIAFQITDDILDETSDAATLGKTAGKDAEQGKQTYPALLGLAGSREAALDEVAGAKAALAGYAGPEADFLRALAQYIADRVY